MEHFNKLTPAEAERLAILAEECAEVIQVVGKILRHGYDSHNPDEPDDGTNRDQLECELGHIAAAQERMALAEDINESAVRQAGRLKYAKVTRYMHHLEG